MNERRRGGTRGGRVEEPSMADPLRTIVTLAWMLNPQTGKPMARWVLASGETITRSAAA